MPLINLALVVETSPDPASREIKEVAATVQRQISRDFAPMWQVDATIDPSSTSRRPAGLLADRRAGRLPRHGHHRHPPRPQGAAVRPRPQQPDLVAHREPRGARDDLRPLGQPADAGWLAPAGPGHRGAAGRGVRSAGRASRTPTRSTATWSPTSSPRATTTPWPSRAAATASRGPSSDPGAIAPGGYLAWREPTADEWWAWTGSTPAAGVPATRAAVGPHQAASPAGQRVLDAQGHQGGEDEGAPDAALAVGGAPEQDQEEDQGDRFVDDPGAFAHDRGELGADRLAHRVGPASRTPTSRTIP